MNRRHTVVPIPVVITVLLALASFYLFFPPHKAYEQIKDYMWERREAKRQAEGRRKQQEFRRAKKKKAQERLDHLRAPVRGYVDDALADSAFFEFAVIPYRSGRPMLWRYEKGKALHRMCRGDRDGSTDSISGFVMIEEERALLLDLLNLIARDGLAEQEDEKRLSVLDGGELRFSFSFGNCRGQFRLINIDPQHLEKFQFKVNELTRLTRDSHPQSECPPWTDKPREHKSQFPPIPLEAIRETTGANPDFSPAIEANPPRWF